MAGRVWLGTGSAWGTGANWVGASAPSTSGDTATFDWNGVGNLAGSDQSATTLDQLDIWSTFQSYAFGDNATPLKVKATIVRIGLPSNSATAGQHSGRINLDLSSVSSTIYVFGTKSSSTDTGKEPVRIKGSGASNKITVTGSSRVGIATDALTDTATFAEVACLDTTSIVNVGSGTTLTKWRQEAGVGNLFCAMTTMQQDAGTLNHYGTGAVTTASITGIANLNASGTITTLNVYAGGHADLSASLAKTVTTINLYKDSELTIDPGLITVSNPINLVGCSLEDVTINLPDGRTVTIA